MQVDVYSGFRGIPWRVLHTTLWWVKTAGKHIFDKSLFLETIEDMHITDDMQTDRETYDRRICDIKQT